MIGLILFIGLTYIGTKAWNTYAQEVRKQEIRPTLEGYIEYLAHQTKKIIRKIKEA